ncbi:helix-turn-helix transcriptional regulator [Roseibium sp. Sym1]|uniref:helix-turn-helix transcriptional regulator n=1 Tax=Roseibium sp. Sym1 TaxID=3016006 RepID=UPI0022B31F33|nr:AraC family transcriptional regulator [Roseibium sp. Sym1]
MSIAPSPPSPLTLRETASPEVERLLSVVRDLATSEGVTPTPLANVWVMRIGNNVPYHRGRNSGLSVAVAVSGRKIVTLDGRTVVNDSGQVIAMHGDTAYEAVVRASPAEPYIALKLQLPPDLVAGTLVRFAETGQEPPSAENSSLLSSQPLDNALAGPLLRLLECFREPADCHMLAPLHLKEICYRILRSPAFGVLRSLVSGADARLVKALHYIETHADRADLTVAEIASEVAMSPSRFAHGFTALYGQSPMQYRKQVRLERARRYLLSAGSSVAVAAEQAGYASQSHFTRDFKSLFGLAPRQYANAMRSARLASA